MKAFAFDRHVIASYERFSRSFSTVRAEDLRSEIDRQYESKRFWPEGLLSLNPRFRAEATVDRLVEEGTLDEATGRIFQLPGSGRLYRHQEQAIAKAVAGKSYVVTTGTGSGKSLCFFVPIVDAVVRARKAREPRRTRAVVVYPMNALANSQINEIEGFVDRSGLPEDLKPVVRRYTGQESQEERQRIAKEPPDVLLTNFMMAELLLTRQDNLDTQVMNHARGLEFIVLDEFHTYRGRQGADVAILVRRLRNRCVPPDQTPVCIGTSATMANEGASASRAQTVAGVAAQLFGASIGPEDVIDESLQRATDDGLKLRHVRPRLAEVVRAELPPDLTDETLRTHPLAVWVELAIGLEDQQELTRKKPIPFDEAAERLARDSGQNREVCRARLEQFLTMVSLPETERGGTGRGAFLAFKLHRFLSGAGEVYTTLTPAPRRVLFDGQLQDPETGHRLYPTRFCRACGHEVHVVTRARRNGEECFLPRPIDDTPIDDQDPDNVAGYLTPTGKPGDAEYLFTGELPTFPEDWREDRKGSERLRPNRKKQVPEPLTVGPDGRCGGPGASFWFIPGRFRFCPCCLDQPHPAMWERSKLTGLSGEGRSSATTLLVSTALEWMNRESSAVSPEKRKLLGFTDNRQDAALQAGHFNDFLFVSLLRGATFRAVLDAGDDGLSEEEFGLALVKALGFTADNKAARIHWMLESEAGAVGREAAQRALAKVLAHRVWTDLRRGWRYTNPSLKVLQLVDFRFVGLEDVANDVGSLGTVLPQPVAEHPEHRKELLRIILEAMLEGLAVNTEALDTPTLDAVAQGSRSLLRAPWAMDQQEQLRSRKALILKSANLKSNKKSGGEQLVIRAGHNSRIGRAVRKIPGMNLGRDDYAQVMAGLMELMDREGLVSRWEMEDDLHGWRLSPAAVRLVPGPAERQGKPMGNRYFHDLYHAVAEDLKRGGSVYWGLESREHTAQVDQKQRQWREWRFRYEEEDCKKITENRAEIKAAGEPDQFLPALFCSPTMELGVDISALNTVYLRNVPPTPANYAQRAGRAGRSGQAAVIMAYCAAQSPHDQYFFKRRNHMVAGVVRPPVLDITNEELVRSHLHAVWLAKTNLALSPDISQVLDLQQSPTFPLKREILDVIHQKNLADAAQVEMRKVLDRILASVDGAKPPLWMGDPGNLDNFALGIAQRTPERFDRAFERWRQLYNAARTQLQEANARSVTPGLSHQERRKVKAAQSQASNQIALLEQGKASNGSDFYSYRYLATEGFLPGYNFPRLPLYAFIPGERKTGSFLQRARFLAIAEFGPRSLIYHEGRAYRVIKAKLPPEVRTSDGSELATRDIFICPNCGACHPNEVERCHACNQSMASETPVQRTLRIDNVEAAPATRITANDEDRIRQGFEIRTVFSWPQREGRLQIQEADFRCGETTVLVLQYANSAEISRINKGLKRRKNQTVFGFPIDPQTGRWTKLEAEENEEEESPEVSRPVRVVPIVQERKNALLLRFHEPEAYDPETMATVRHALVRGIAVVFQLEEGEVLSEPLPEHDNCRAILTYEATEGGAGVLNRLVDDPRALARVARTALELMHFPKDRVEAAVAAGDVSLLVDEPEDACVRGCYRCLLSYFNQPDHELIDRTHSQAKQLLVDLARGEVVPKAAPSNGSRQTGPWLEVFKEAGLPAPDAEPIAMAGQEFPFVWRSHFAAVTTAAVTDAVREHGHARGWLLFPLPDSTAEGLPGGLMDVFKDAAE